MRGTVRKVGAEPWDWVIFQEQSAGIAEALPTIKGPQYRYDDMRGFNTVVTEAGHGSEVMMLMT